MLVLYQHFVQPGVFDSAHASFYTRLMQARIEGDYSDTIIEDEESTSEFIDPTHNYIKYVETFIN